MKIGIDIRSLLAAPYGGVSEYGKNIIPALFAAAGPHEFFLFSNAYARDSFPEWLVPYQAAIRSFHYPNKIFSLSTRFARFPKLDKMVGGVDVWFSPHMLPSPVSAKTPLVTTFHDLSFERFPYFFDARRRAWHAFVNPRQTARSSTRIIAVSEATRQDIIALYGIAPSAVKVVYPGVPVRPPAQPADRVEQFPYLLSLCTLEPRKNLPALIAAFERVAQTPILANHHLVIAGPQGWSWGSIERLIVTSPFRERIHQVGAVSPGRVSALYEGASLFVYPSFYEGFGFPPLEAMAAGVPVIASMTSSLPEVVGDAGVLVDPYRVDTLAKLLVEFMEDASLREDSIRRGRERAACFSWQAAARETILVLEEAFFHRER